MHSVVKATFFSDEKDKEDTIFTQFVPQEYYYFLAKT